MLKYKYILITAIISSLFGCSSEYNRNNCDTIGSKPCSIEELRKNDNNNLNFEQMQRQAQREQQQMQQIKQFKDYNTKKL